MKIMKKRKWILFLLIFFVGIFLLIWAKQPRPTEVEKVAERIKNFEMTEIPDSLKMRYDVKEMINFQDIVRNYADEYLKYIKSDEKKKEHNYKSIVCGNVQCLTLVVMHTRDYRVFTANEINRDSIFEMIGNNANNYLEQ